MKRSSQTLRLSAARGFTLIELLLVLVILAVLAAVVVPKLTGRVEQSRKTGTITDIAGMKTAVGAFEVDCGRVPTDSEGLDALVVNPGGDVSGFWNGPYIDQVKTDKWGIPYQYSSSSTRDFNIISAGPDHQFGTEDDMDINSTVTN